MANVFNEALISNNPSSISKNELQKIIYQMNNSICKINYNHIFGTGFFCAINISDQNQHLNYFFALITSNHVLNENIIGHTIILEINEISFPLIINESRKFYSDKEKDISIIEIKKGEITNINPLYIDENIFNENPQNIFREIYILHYEFGKEAKFSIGTIKKFDIINNLNAIFYSCSTQPGSSGGPVINSKTNKVIGLHKGFDARYGLNLGIFICEAIVKFNKWYKNLINNNDNCKNNLTNNSNILDQFNTEQCYRNTTNINNHCGNNNMNNIQNNNFNTMNNNNGINNFNDNKNKVNNFIQNNLMNSNILNFNNFNQNNSVMNNGNIGNANNFNSNMSNINNNMNNYIQNNNNSNSNMNSNIYNNLNTNLNNTNNFDFLNNKNLINNNSLNDVNNSIINSNNSMNKNINNIMNNNNNNFINNNYNNNTIALNNISNKNININENNIMNNSINIMDNGISNQNINMFNNTGNNILINMNNNFNNFNNNMNNINMMSSNNNNLINNVNNIDNTYSNNINKYNCNNGLNPIGFNPNNTINNTNYIINNCSYNMGMNITNNNMTNLFNNMNNMNMSNSVSNMNNNMTNLFNNMNMSNSVNNMNSNMINLFNNMNNMNNMNMSNSTINMNNFNNFSNENIVNNFKNMNNDINNNDNNKINNNLKEIKDIHDHPLILSNQNYKLCNICLKKLNNTLAYECTSCLIFVCQECIKNIFNEKININLEPHILKLKFNPQKWTCYKCFKSYDSKKCISLYCDRCNLNICDICYLSQNNNQIDDSNKENSNSSDEISLRNRSSYGFCCFCNCKMEKTSGYILNNNRSLLLCASCHKIMFVDGYRPKISLHSHKLGLAIRKSWFCNKCRKLNYNRISFYCSFCDFDLCYDCYYDWINIEDDNTNEENEDIKPSINEIILAGKVINSCYNQ